MVRLIIPNTPRTGIVRMMVTTAIIAVVIVRTIMPTAICTVMIRPREIEMIMVGVSDVNPKRPTTTTYINRTVKIGGLHETAVLPVIQHPIEGRHCAHPDNRNSDSMPIPPPEERHPSDSVYRK